MPLKDKQLTFGIILPYIWIFMFFCLIGISFVSMRISSIIAAENLILLTFILSPLVYITGIFISFVTMLKSGPGKNLLFGIAFNIVLLIVWFIFKNSMYIELNMIG